MHVLTLYQATSTSPQSQSVSKKSSRQYSTAARLANYALALTTITLVFTALAWLLYIGLIIYLTSGCRFIVYESSDGGYRKSSCFTFHSE